MSSGSFNFDYEKVIIHDIIIKISQKCEQQTTEKVDAIYIVSTFLFLKKGNHLNGSYIHMR